MTHKNILTATTIILTCSILACKKMDSDLTNGQWKVESIIQSGSSTSQNTTRTYTFEFKDQNTFSLGLAFRNNDIFINSCVG